MALGTFKILCKNIKSSRGVDQQNHSQPCISRLGHHLACSGCTWFQVRIRLSSVIKWGKVLGTARCCGSAWQCDNSQLREGRVCLGSQFWGAVTVVARVWANWYMAVTASSQRNGESAVFLWAKTSARRKMQPTFRADFQPQLTNLEAPSQVCPMAYLLDYSRSCHSDNISCQKKKKNWWRGLSSHQHHVHL